MGRDANRTPVQGMLSEKKLPARLRSEAAIIFAPAANSFRSAWDVPLPNKLRSSRHRKLTDKSLRAIAIRDADTRSAEHIPGRRTRHEIIEHGTRHGHETSNRVTSHASGAWDFLTKMLPTDVSQRVLTFH